MHTNPATSHMFIVNPLSGLHFCLKVLRQVKRPVIAIVGFTVLFIGIAMIVLPGPAFIVILTGIGILATEFVWVRSLLKEVKN